jgi:hypothetical protein
MTDTPQPIVFNLPAFIEDLPPGSPEAALLKQRWNIDLGGYVGQAATAGSAFFYDPSNPSTWIKTGALGPSALVQWAPFPNRVVQFYAANQVPPNPYGLAKVDIYSLADTGSYIDSSGQRTSFPAMPAKVFPSADWSATVPFSSYGPRGWLDEYCEWSVARDESNDIVRIDFTCESPEYWNSLWKVSPQTVCDIYNSVLNYDAPSDSQVTVALADLYLLDANGNPVTDPETTLPAYNPLNKWNNGPRSVRNGRTSTTTIGGAMHLTSVANTLQTELGLAGGATPQFNPNDNTGNSNAQSLISCGMYGQQYRNSDPHIGLSINQLVGGFRSNGSSPCAPGTYFCLANPMGLYIQGLFNPDAFSYGSRVNPAALPKGAKASDVWQIVRGKRSPVDPVTGAPFPGDMILHVVCQIPSSWRGKHTPELTLADILINGEPISYAGQVAYQFHIGLFARPLALPQGALNPPAPPFVPCVNTSSPSPGAPQQVLLFTQVWNALYANLSLAPTGMSMPLAGNSTFIAPRVVANGSTYQMSLTCNPFTTMPTGSAGWPFVQLSLPNATNPDPGISVTVTGAENCTYVIPGNSGTGKYVSLTLQVTVSPYCKKGFRTVSVTDPSSGTVSTLIAAIYIVEEN